ncbi:hypothetical protein LCGC14_0793000 [marine sediment metagenome]|uniref:Transcriptional coactivator p15 (PC4) C-terminal domain-containing protein n=1 Tax=marine sediment metagenome TaxID=412755 RepID=A0A0F9PRZ0_9ZZZZ
MSSKSVTQAREIKNGGDTKLVVSAGTWRKKGYVDIRNYWRSPDGEWHPTKRGVRVDQGDAVHIAAAVHNLIDELWPVAPKPSRNGSKPAVKRPYKPPVRHEPDTSIRPRYLTPGKDHRRTHGKATFSRKGGIVTCKTTAYWGNPIHAPITAEEWAVCSATTQAVQHVGSIIGYPKSKQIIRPSVLVPPGVYRPNTLELAA